MTATPEVLAVIPARYAATRFPGKVLADIAGKPMAARVYEKVLLARHVTRAIVATDDIRVCDALGIHKIPVVLTRPDHMSGTDRIAEAVRDSQADIIVNVQGDEPLIDPRTIDDAIQPLLDDPTLPMATARKRLTDITRIASPDVVKVVCAPDGRALYFSRHPIPYIRDVVETARVAHWQHVGLYVYRRTFLLEYASWPQTPLEQLEKLEQLRVLEHGYPIAVIETAYESIGVDVPEDLERVRGLFRR